MEEYKKKLWGKLKKGWRILPVSQGSTSEIGNVKDRTDTFI